MMNEFLESLNNIVLECQLKSPFFLKFIFPYPECLGLIPYHPKMFYLPGSLHYLGEPKLFNSCCIF